MTTQIYGASDDLIEVDGQVSEEFSALGNDSSLLAFSDGTVLRVTYDDNDIWRIALVVQGSATLAIQQAPEDDERNYTDRATLDGDIRWAVLGTEIAKASAVTQERTQPQ